MIRPSLRSSLAGALMLLAQFAPHLAHAQYSWLDEHGTRVFSDRPPPPGTPPSRILKSPHAATPPTADAVPSAAPAAPAAAEQPKPPTLADREADYRKRQAQQQEDDKKARDDAGRQAAQQASCDAARQEMAQLGSGMRIATVDAKGERSYLSDEDRARRVARAQQAMASCQQGG